LIVDVLSFAKLESGRLEYHHEEVVLDDFLSTLEGFVAPRLAKKNLTFRVEPCGQDNRATIDRSKVEQIMLNLLSNAVKFTDAGTVAVGCRLDPDTVWIDVRDTGRGIGRETLGSIFEPFVQGEHSLTRTIEGTGLGLAISRQLARAMGGDISVESAPGSGSTFTVVLPRTPQG
jgi:signal transduction histidine kinase